MADIMSQMLSIQWQTQEGFQERRRSAKLILGSMIRGKKRENNQTLQLEFKFFDLKTGDSAEIPKN